MKRIAFIIASRGFRDEEFFTPYNYLKDKFEIEVFSTKKGKAIGSIGGEFEVSNLIDDLDVDKFDAIVFVGGPGTPEVRAYEKVYDKIKEALEKNKIIAAICWSPTILAKAQALKGLKATVWKGFDNEFNMETQEVLANFGAEFVDKEVIRDNNIITANGPRAAMEYAKEIEKALES